MNPQEFLSDYISERVVQWRQLGYSDKMITKLKAELYDVFDSYLVRNNMFICMTNSGTKPPKYRHFSFESAYNEAKRLSITYKTPTRVFMELARVNEKGQYDSLPF